ncbi:MAG: ketopantoate reductase family protein [Prolixibacteraceae bacterium]|nr:ketopantoate reductase family protein [Prolixibacteraceae bacterium]
MKIAIIGTGGVGGYFGARLAHAKHDVTFVARGEHLKALLKNGLTLKSILGDIHIPEVKATDKIVDIENPELILVAVKAWQVKEIRDGLKNIVGQDTVIIPLQNGVSAADELAEVIEHKNIMGGLCRIISKIESPGVIHHFGVTPTIVFGELDKKVTDRATEIKKLFDNAGIASKLSEDIEAEIWKKFIAICVSGLMAVSKTNYGEMRDLKVTREMMITLLNEVYALSQKIGLNIEKDFVEKTLSFIDSIAFESTPSLARDEWEGRPSEIEYQNGTVVRLGEKYAVDTPINRFVYHCILPMELKARTGN